MPYRIFSIMNTDIQYSYGQGVIEFRLNKIYRKDSLKSTGTTTYNLYISNSSESITQMTKCSLGNVYTITKIQAGDTISAENSYEYVKFSIKVNLFLLRLKKSRKLSEILRLSLLEPRLH